MGSRNMLQRSGLGRSGHLGALYDFRTDSFQGDTIFNSKLEPEEDIDPTELGTTAVELLMSDSFEDKFHHLDIEAELSVSILSGLVKVSGSGKFLEEKKKTSKSSSMSLIYKVTTLNEEIYLRRLRNKVDLDALEASEATHVLTGVDWGAICTVTAQYTFSDGAQKTKVEGALKAELNKLKGVLDVSGSANVAFNEGEMENSEQFKFFSKCDVGNSGQDLPVTFQEAVLQAKSLPKLVKSTNQGKGVPLKFVFTPLSTVRKWFKQEASANIAYKAVSESSLKRVVFLAQQMSDTKQIIEEFHNALLDGKECIAQSHINESGDLLSAYIQNDAKFREQLQQILKSVRSAEADISELEVILGEFEGGHLSPVRIADKLAEKEVLIEKIKTMKQLEQSGIRYFGRTQRIDFWAEDEVYILYLKEAIQTNKSMNFLMTLKHASKDKIHIAFCVKDLSVAPKGQDDNYVDKIHQYKKGQLVEQDVAEKIGRDTESCLVQLMDPIPCSQLPHDRAELVLRCPDSYSVSGTSGLSGCSSNTKEWKCFKCKNIVLYGLTTGFYYCLTCKVACEPKNTQYRCGEAEHGIEFKFYDDNFLPNELAKIKTSNQINVLILGETGVGKSTWINSFANYISFDSLQSAIENSKDDPVVAIPSKFTFTKGGETKHVLIGDQNDPGEMHDIGKSNTQGAKTYPFKVGSTVVNLIDTPGIGDTRGSKQDDENMDRILSHLTYYDELHGIIVLLKPNNARLGIMFKHCIQQLLSHLHRSAAHNISFVFTNTRGTFYEPGETLPALKSLLKEKNMGIEAVERNIFSFDNEAFRLLACVLNGIKFDQKVLAVYEGSWEKAVDETNRLLKHIIEDTTPHIVKDTTSLNDARRIIVVLSKPLQEFARTIKLNERKVVEHLLQIEALGSEAKKFQSNLEFEVYTLESKILSKPRTVCTHEKCVDLVPIGQGEETKINYIRHCHEGCNLGGEGGVTPELRGDPKLQQCWAINNNVCRHSNCGHHYKDHMHMTYELDLVMKKIVSKKVQTQLDSKLSEKEKVENEKKGLERLGKEFSEEGKIIREVAAGFAAFLKIHAIIPFSDAMGDYIDIQIEDEKSKTDFDGKQSTRIKEWTEYKAEYEERKNILTDAMDEVKDTDQGKVDAAKDVKDLLQKAFELKHFGKDIEVAYKKIESQKGKMPQYAQGPTRQLKSASGIKKLKPAGLVEKAKDKLVTFFTGT